MEETICFSEADCDDLYQCLGGKCVHDDIFPLSAYTIILYVIMGLAAAFCNVAGQSMGIFKMLLLIILLKYQLDEGTGLAQAMVVGTAIPNFFSVILKKHPNQQTSLVNYKLLLIIIPCCLLGSTVGSLGQTLIPKIGQLALLVLVFLYFAIGFIQKLRATCKNSETHLKSSLIQSSAPQIILSNNTEQLQFNTERAKILAYQKSHHFGQILFSIFVFIVFESLSFFVQGKLPFYDVSKCSFEFCLGIIAIFALTLVYLFMLFVKMKLIFSKYDKYNIPQEIHLNKYQEFLKITAGAFAAGTIQGLLGMGCGTCIVMVLLSFPIASTSASATSGYQILFTGSASLLEYYINGEVKLFESLWIMGVCLIIGGISTIFLYRIVEKLNQLYVNRFLYSIITVLCLMSIGLVAPTVMHILKREGWDGLMSIDFQC